MNFFCNNCKKKIFNSHKIYKSMSTQRELSVYVCPNCSLVQSFPRIDKVLKRKVSVSGGADWGNIRYGKGFRSKFAISIIEKYKKLTDFLKVLDVGSSRGSFLDDFYQKNDKALFVGVEPDVNLKKNYSSKLHIKLINNRIENIELEDSFFDLVHCSHTLEHLSDPISVLFKIYKALKPNGLMFLEVPNINCITNKNLFEEFFIDKHLYHYSEKTLEDALFVANFKVIKKYIDNDNLTYLVSKKKRGGGSQEKNNFQCIESVNSMKKDILSYLKNLKKAKQAYVEVSRYIKSYLPKKIVFWGAGRIFDLLLKNGDLKTGDIHALIDSNLYKYTDKMHGIEIQSPALLSKLRPCIIVIASRTYFDEIKKYILAKTDWPVEIFGIIDLIENSSVFKKR